MYIYETTDLFLRHCCGFNWITVHRKTQHEEIIMTDNQTWAFWLYMSGCQLCIINYCYFYHGSHVVLLTSLFTCGLHVLYAWRCFLRKIKVACHKAKKVTQGGHKSHPGGGHNGHSRRRPQRPLKEAATMDTQGGGHKGYSRRRLQTESLRRWNFSHVGFYTY